MISRLFDCLNSEEKRENPFEMPEIDKLRDRLFEATELEKCDDSETVQDMIRELLLAERSTAFEIGFRAAVSMFAEGLKGVNT